MKTKSNLIPVMRMIVAEYNPSPKRLFQNLFNRKYELADYVEFESKRIAQEFNARKQAVTDRDRFEREMARRLGKSWAEQKDKLIRLLGNPPSLSNVPESYWEAEGAAIRKAVVPVFEEIYLAQSFAIANDVRIGLDWGLINQRAVEWASRHSGEFIQGIDKTTRDAVTSYVNKYYTEGWTLEDITDRLEPIFGKQRAQTIAITETTNAATQSELATVNYLETQYPNLNFKGTWITALDDRVCEICGPKHGKVIDDGDYPPAHVNCRCEVSYEAKVV